MDKREKMPVLIFGASGFIGRSAAEHLSQKGYQLLTPSSKECDLLNTNQLREYLLSIDTPVQIVFCAGILLQRDNSFSSMTKNIQMVQSLAEGTSALSIRSVIYLSSTDVYGNPSEIITEKTAISPRSYYGLSKYSGEIIFGMPSYFAMPVTILRIPGVYGPGDHQKGTVSFFLNQLINNEVVTIHGNGNALRDYVNVNDVSRLIEHFLCSPCRGTLNVATGRSISIKELIRALGEALGISPRISFKVNGDSYSYRNLVFDITHLKKIVPTFQFTDIDRGIVNYVSSLAQN